MVGVILLMEWTCAVVLVYSVGVMFGEVNVFVDCASVGRGRSDERICRVSE